MLFRSEIIARGSSTTVRVRTPQAAALEALMRRFGATVTSTEADVLEVQGSSAPAIGDAAAAAAIPLHELVPLHGSLEDAYMQLTADDVEYHSATIGTEMNNIPTQPSATALLTEGALR